MRWVLIPKFLNPSDFKFLLITPDSIHIFNRSTFKNRFYIDLGQSVFSLDGTSYATITFYGLSPNYTVFLDLYSFDRCSGELTWRGQDIYQGLYPACGVAFSPDSKLLYLSLGRKLMQYDMSQEQYQSTRMEIDTFDGFHDPIHTTFFMLQNAPDGKIYMSATNTVRYLHVINDPNIRGKGCNFKYQNRTSLSTRDWLPGIYAVRIVRYGRVLAWDKVVKR
ncbi:MAG: hypothetical protein IPQ18_04110 [Saprospiraceae bacterium]|nr:hypothetical protein [Saprospiraceae bacterium]